VGVTGAAMLAIAAAAIAAGVAAAAAEGEAAEVAGIDLPRRAVFCCPATPATKPGYFLASYLAAE